MHRSVFVSIMADVQCLAATAFNQLCRRLQKAPLITLQAFEKLVPPASHIPSNAALFVTWTKHDDLRGCIGTFAPGPVEETVRQYAEVAAFEDPRFSPVRVSEVPKLTAAVTLLGPLEPINDFYDWEIGVHGVRAEFDGLSSTFLPEVAEEQGWDRKETIRQLAHKAGVSSRETPTRMWRYLGRKGRISWSEYQKLVS